MSMMLMWPLLLLLGGQDAVSIVDSDLYWQQKQIRMEAPAIMPLLEAKAQPDAGDPAPWIAKLGAADAADRAEARRKLAAMGARIEPQLKALLDDDDPEIAITAKELLADIDESRVDVTQLDQVQRLMAIRTLGELKARDALPLLQPLTESTAPFEAAYARRAIAAITAAEPPDPEPAADRLQPLEALIPHLPADSHLVARLVLPEGDTIGELTKGLGPAMGGMTLEQIRRGITPQILIVLRRIGNIQIDGAVLAVSGDPNRVAITLIIHGSWDAPAIMQAATLDAGKFTVTKVAGRDALMKPDKEAYLVFLDEHTLVFGFQDNRIYPAETIISDLIEKKPTLAENTELTALLARVDRSAMAWAASVLPAPWRDELAREEPAFAGARSITAQAVPAPDEPHIYQWTFIGDAADPASAKAVHGFLETGIAEGIQELEENIEKAPPNFQATFKPVIDILRGVKLETADTTVTLTARQPLSGLFSPMALVLAAPRMMR